MRNVTLIIFISLIGRISLLSAQDIQYGNLYTLIYQIKNAMPDIDSYGFAVPDPTQQDSFATVIDSLIAQNYTAVDSMAVKQGYKLIEWYDTAYQNRRYYVLMEKLGNQSGGVEYGWGTYLFYPEGSNRLIIEVPHPLHDLHTWHVGFYLFQRLGFKFLLIAGTHRYANGSNPAPADVAHNTSNIFHTVHQRISTHAQYSFQVHGFSRDDYPDIVLSNGTPSPYLVIDTLATELISKEFSVGVYDGVNYSAYGATTNLQGQWSRTNGYAFIHMELERFIRDSESEWGKVIEAIERTFFNISTLLADHEDQLTGHILLFPNYPNPFNPVTYFRFFLPQKEEIQLRLYNISGQLIREIYTGILWPGNHSIQWDIRDKIQDNIASGTYILELRTPRQQLSQKIYYLK